MDKENVTRQNIYQCVLGILEAEGPQAVTMRRVANEVGITAMAIYYHFPSREALLGAIVDSEFEQLVNFFTASGKNGTFENKIIHCLDGYISYALAHPRIFDYVFSSTRPGARRFPEDFRARLSPTLNLVADMIEEGIKLGKLKRDDPWEIAMELWAHVHGYLMLYRAGRFSLEKEEFRKLVHRSLRRLLHGLVS